MSRQPGSTPPRVCPECGDFRFGSVMADDGTLTRHCHGEVYLLADGSVIKHATPAMKEEFIQAIKVQRPPSFEIRPCSHTWHQSKDAENGLFNDHDDVEIAGVAN